uniref:EGF-like domain-containing protein n=1 Tax=Scophthalmus maximus TaxID=52904 RepID=A0A8D3CGT2_SCOMX
RKSVHPREAVSQWVALGADCERGHCAGNRCFVLLREPEDFAGAQRSCRDSGGQLLAIDSEQEAETLANALGERSGGSYWLELLGSGAAAEGAAAGLQNCSSVCASAGGSPAVSWKRCRDRLDGFLCQYTFSEPCGLLQAGGSAQVVRYTTARGFEVNDSETFPPGTIAAAGEVAGEYPDSKHVCFEGKWLRAPWRCEVLMGGCDHGCNSTTTTTHTCTCPAGQTLHPNSFSCAKGPCVDCAKDPCVDCAQGCLPEGDSYACVCASGYRLARDGRSCVDVDECEEADRCPAEGEECLNTEGGFECGCREGFDLEDGACMNVSICDECEHMCENSGGVFVCHCAGENCLARCDNSCEDLFGGYRCLCNGGFELHGGKCVPVQGPEEEGGSGSPPPPPPPPPPHTTTKCAFFLLFFARHIYFPHNNVIFRVILPVMLHLDV